jgi:hypothetical protein
MPKTLNDLFGGSQSNQTFPSLRRVKQETDHFCGPAVLQMLASFKGVTFSQHDVVRAANVAEKIKDEGMSVPELGQAISVLAPELQFWYKKNSSLSELSQLINSYNYPVGVEWQGLFEHLNSEEYPDDVEEDEDDSDSDEDDDEEDDDDYGHFGVVTKVDTHNNEVLIADPYGRYAGKDRHFAVMEFERRWWDDNDVYNPYTQRMEKVEDNKAMFLLVPKTEHFPELFNMNRI